MKKHAFLLTVAILSLVLSISACKKTKEQEPCNNKGKLCLENKMDSSVVITIKPINSQFTLQKDYTKCSELPGNNPYTVTIATPSTSRDTTIFILPCDNKLIILR